jgi:hypothetical protein
MVFRRSRAPLVPLFSVAIVLASLGCVAKAPTGTVVADQTCSTASPTGYNICPGNSGGCVNDGDPGCPAHPDCTVVGDVEVANFPLGDFEGVKGNQNLPAVTYFYTYTDGTAGVIPLVTDANGNPPSGYQPQTTPGKHCKQDTGSFVLHLTNVPAGAPFLSWGGGMGVGMEHIAHGADIIGSGKPCDDSSTAPSWCIPHPQPGAPGQSIAGAAVDASQFDGVSFWARRGPQSQSLLRVLVGNKDTDDDISYLMARDEPTLPRYCERIRDCGCNYAHLTCDFYPEGDARIPPDQTVRPGGGFYCGPPGAPPAPGVITQANMANSSPYPSNSCNHTKCDDDYPAYPSNPDPVFNGKPCTQYQFRTGSQASLCYDPSTDPKPPEPDQQCGDHWTFPVHLTDQWQFYTVPFSQMYQEGWAKKIPYFDLHSVSVVRLTWDVGFVDYWIDDMRFYKVKRPATDAGAGQ